MVSNPIYALFDISLAPLSSHALLERRLDRSSSRADPLAVGATLDEARRASNYLASVGHKPIMAYFQVCLEAFQLLQILSFSLAWDQVAIAASARKQGFLYDQRSYARASYFLSLSDAASNEDPRESKSRASENLFLHITKYNDFLNILLHLRLSGARKPSASRPAALRSSMAEYRYSEQRFYQLDEELLHFLSKNNIKSNGTLRASPSK